jgi:hypothetical protein
MSDPSDLPDAQDALNQACWDGDLEAVRQILSSSDSEALADGDHGERWEDEAYGCTTGAPFKRPLSRAAERGHLAIVEELLASGAKVDAVNYRSETALHLAVAEGQQACIEVLLAAGADTDRVACDGSVLAHARTNVERITYLLDRGADPRPVDAFGRDAADLIDKNQSWPLEDRIAALRLYVDRWPEGDPAVDRHRAQLVALEAELEEAAASEQRRNASLAALVAPQALRAADWAKQIKASFPESMWEFDPDLSDDEKPRAHVDLLREAVLSQPEAIAHPAWGEVLQALINLSPDYREVTEDAYGEPLDPSEADEDEGGVLDMFDFEEPSTIPDAFRLLAHPTAVARSDWADLVRYTVDAHTARYGKSPCLMSGRDEADELFAKPEVRAHDAAGDLWDLVDGVFDLTTERP